MNALRYQLKRFFSGRYGMDALGYAMLGTWFAICVVNLFVPSAVAALILDILGMGVWVCLLLRIFSRNLPARRKENERFCRLFSAPIAQTRLWRDMWRDRKTHIYRKCPSCHAVLRLKKLSGEHTAICPKCRERVTVKIK